MWKKLVNMLSAVAACLCVVGGIHSALAQAGSGLSRPAFIYSADANAPWIPAEHLTAAWESVTLMSQIYNPLERPGSTASRSLSISGTIDIVDTNGLIGLSTGQQAILALDQNGKVIYSSPADLPRSRFYRSPNSFASLVRPSSSTPQTLTQHFGLTLPMDPNAGYPLLLSKLEWSIDALVADTTKRIDIPFAKTTEWAEVMPGLEIIVEDASVQGTTYNYRIKARYDSTIVQYSAGGSVYVSDYSPLPKAALIQIDVLNAQGVSVRDLSTSGAYSGGSSASGSNNQMTATLTGSGSCSACGTAAIIRQVFAVDPYEKEVQFVLENIPVPTL